VGGVFRVAVSRVGAGLRENDQVTMGRTDRQGDLFDDVVRFCEDSLPGNSIYGFLARERDRLFPDELFDDLFEASGRRSVPQLPHRRQVLVRALFADDEVRYADITKALGLPPGSIGPTRARMLRSLRGVLEQVGIDEAC
jgi:hypothetical protein